MYGDILGPLNPPKSVTGGHQKGPGMTIFGPTFFCFCADFLGGSNGPNIGPCMDVPCHAQSCLLQSGKLFYCPPFQVKCLNFLLKNAFIISLTLGVGSKKLSLPSVSGMIDQDD